MSLDEAINAEPVNPDSLLDEDHGGVARELLDEADADLAAQWEVEEEAVDLGNALAAVIRRVIREELAAFFPPQIVVPDENGGIDLPEDPPDPL